ncbi:hypothetical protein K7X08_035166 [Anisodus acutangulus]|uniref:Uncharacterized protein n=1 Tax=Anisodus acutangulus TaxID=402998 RepID=A0A9Q1LJY5_9SOLA|nr:hypothetical protein K7X08_035166 [Anisodus acutangulus]
MTDCSSSVSSAPDSESLHFKSTYGGTKRKTTRDVENLNMPKSELFDFDPPRTFSEGRLNHPRASSLRYSLISEDINLFDEFGKSSLSFDNKPCVHRQSLDTYMTKDLFEVHAMETPTTGVPTATKKLFFGASDLQEFLTTVEIDSSPDACTSVRDPEQGSS